MMKQCYTQSVVCRLKQDVQTSVLSVEKYSNNGNSCILVQMLSFNSEEIDKSGSDTAI